MSCQKEYDEFIKKEGEMDYWYVLITIDIYGIDSNLRKNFNQNLTDEGWGEIENLTTSWQISFPRNYTNGMIIEELESDIKKAKKKMNITKVNYAIQVGNEKIKIENKYNKLTK